MQTTFDQPKTLKSSASHRDHAEDVGGDPYWPGLDRALGINEGSSRLIDCTKRSHLSGTFCSQCTLKCALSNLLFERIVIFDGYLCLLLHFLMVFSFQFCFGDSNV